MLYKYRMQLERDLTVHDTVHLATDLAAIGSFRLDCDAPTFRAPKALAHLHLVLPRTAMGIVQDTGAPFVADPMVLTVHAPGVVYRREPIGGQPDESDYLVLGEAALDELFGTRGAGRGGQRTIDAGTYAQAQVLFAAAREGRASTLALEEAALGVAG
jgi:hypothetical protein